MRPLKIVMINPVRDLIVRFIERNKIILPNAFLLEAPEESLDHAILLRRIRCYILLEQMEWTLPDLVETRLSLSETKRRRGYGNEEKDVHRRIQT
jgi:hypothetical protein